MADGFNPQSRKRLLDMCREKGIASTKEEVDQLVEDAKARGKTFEQLEHRLVKLPARSRTASTATKSSTGEGQSSVKTSAAPSTPGTPSRFGGSANSSGFLPSQGTPSFGPLSAAASQSTAPPSSSAKTPVVSSNKSGKSPRKGGKKSATVSSSTDEDMDGSRRPSDNIREYRRAPPYRNSLTDGDGGEEEDDFDTSGFSRHEDPTTLSSLQTSTGKSESRRSVTEGSFSQGSRGNSTAAPIPQPLPGVGQNDANFWFRELCHYVDAHPRLALSLQEAKWKEKQSKSKEKVDVVTEETLGEFMAQKRRARQPYSTLYHQFNRKYGPLAPGVRRKPEYQHRPGEKHVVPSVRGSSTGGGPLSPVSSRKVNPLANNTVGALANNKTNVKPPPADAQKSQPKKAVTIREEGDEENSAEARALMNKRLGQEGQRMLQRLQRYSDHHKLKQRDAELAAMIFAAFKRGEPLEAVMTRLVHQHGPEPPAPAPVPVIPLTPEERGKEWQRTVAKERLYRYLTYHNLDASDPVLEQMLSHTESKGKNYEFLFDRLKAKYGVGGDEPDPDATGQRSGSQALQVHDMMRFSGTHPAPLSTTQVAAPEFSRREIAEKRLEVFAEHYDWGIQQQGMAGQLLDEAAKKSSSTTSGSDPYEPLFKRLVLMYGPEPPLPVHYHRAAQVHDDLVVAAQRKDVARTPSRAGYQGDDDDVGQGEALRSSASRMSATTGAVGTNQSARDGTSASPDNSAFFNSGRLPSAQYDHEALKAKVTAKVQIYCRHYKLPKSLKEIDQLVDEFQSTLTPGVNPTLQPKGRGWDAMLRKMERRFGPVPWPKHEHSLLMEEIHYHQDGGRQQEHETYMLATAERDKRKLLARFNEVHDIGWTAQDMSRMMSAMGHGEDGATSNVSGGSGPNFADLITALERKYGPLPPERDRGGGGSSVSGSSVKRTPQDVEAEHSLKRLGVSSPEYQRSLATLGRPQADVELRQEEDEAVFWRDRIKLYLDHYAPEESFSPVEIEKLIQQFSRQKREEVKSHPEYTGADPSQQELYAAFWRHLVSRYGPEPAVPVGQDQTTLQAGAGSLRRYWFLKYKLYCDHYGLKKSHLELEQMLDNYREMGWARMYDQLVDLHGPPPPMPTSASGAARFDNSSRGNIVGASDTLKPMTPEQWETALKRFVQVKCPGKTPAQVDQFVAAMKSLGGGSEGASGKTPADQADLMEKLFEGMVLLLGPASAQDGQLLGSGNLRPLDAGGNLGYAGASSRAMEAPLAATTRIVVCYTGLDPGLFQFSPPPCQQRFARAASQDLCQSIALVDDTLAKLVDVRPHGTEAALEFHLAPSAHVLRHPRFKDMLMESINDSSYRSKNLRISYVEDLGAPSGQGANLLPLSATVTEVKSSPNMESFHHTRGTTSSPQRSDSGYQQTTNPLAQHSPTATKVVAGQGTHYTGATRREETRSTFYGDAGSAAGDLLPAYTHNKSGDLSRHEPPPVASMSLAGEDNTFATASWASPGQQKAPPQPAYGSDTSRGMQGTGAVLNFDPSTFPDTHPSDTGKGPSRGGPDFINAGGPPSPPRGRYTVAGTDPSAGISSGSGTGAVTAVIHSGHGIVPRATTTLLPTTPMAGFETPTHHQPPKSPSVRTPSLGGVTALGNQMDQYGFSHTPPGGHKPQPQSGSHQQNSPSPGIIAQQALERTQSAFGMNRHVSSPQSAQAFSERRERRSLGTTPRWTETNY